MERLISVSIRGSLISIVWSSTIRDECPSRGRYPVGCVHSTCIFVTMPDMLRTQMIIAYDIMSVNQLMIFTDDFRQQVLNAMD